jgi:hypothetical protein
MFVNGSRRNERSLQRTFHRCFLPSFSSFGRGVSEEKINMWKINGRQMTDVKWWQKLTLPLTRWAKNRWLLFLLSWILLASLITHKKNSLNSTIKLLSNDITWNHNIYMGPQVQQELLTLPEHLCSVSWNSVFLFVLFAFGHCTCVVCPFRWIWHLIIYVFCIYKLFLYLVLGPSGLWSYGSWIYNHLCNKCLIISKVMSSNPVHGKDVLNTTLCESLSVTCDRSVVPSTNKTDHNDKTEKCLQVVLNTINENPSTLYISLIKQQLYTKPSKHDM